MNHDQKYKKLIGKILKKGVLRTNRTGIDTLSVFGCKVELDISENLACLTCKKVFTRSVISELIWFLSGSTHVQDLKKIDPKNKIWDGNSSADFIAKCGLPYEEGNIGPGYGYQWRNSGGVDQIRECLDLIQNNPDSRRIILSSWIPADIPKMCLPPCHMMIQFYVRDGYLDAQMYQRSADMFLGVPFNWLSYSILVWLFAKLCDLKPGKLHMVYGDAHIYTSHFDAINQLMKTEPTCGYPTVEFSDDIDIDNMKMSDVKLVGYKPGPIIRAEMAI